MVKDACADEEVHSCMFSEHEAAIAEHHREAIFAKPTGVVDGAKVLYHFVQFGQGGTGGQAGRNLDVGHPEGGQGHLPDFGQSKSSAAC